MTKSELKAQAEGYDDVRDWAADNDLLLCCICGEYRHIDQVRFISDDVRIEDKICSECDTQP